MLSALQNVLNNVRNLYASEEYDNALILLRDYETKNDLSVNLLILKSRLIQLSNSTLVDLKEAESALLSAIDQDKENIQALLETGWFYLNVFDDAKKSLEYFYKADEIISRAGDEAKEGISKAKNELLN